MLSKGIAQHNHSSALSGGSALNPGTLELDTTSQLLSGASYSTYTPTFTFVAGSPVITISSIAGVWWRIGSLAIIMIKMSWAGSTGTGSVGRFSMPFTARSFTNPDFFISGGIRVNGWGATGHQGFFTLSSQTEAYIYPYYCVNTGSAVSNIAMSQSGMAISGDLRFTHLSWVDD